MSIHPIFYILYRTLYTLILLYIILDESIRRRENIPLRRGRNIPVDSLRSRPQANASPSQKAVEHTHTHTRTHVSPLHSHSNNKKQQLHKVSMWPDSTNTKPPVLSSRNDSGNCLKENTSLNCSICALQIAVHPNFIYILYIYKI